MVHLLFFLSRSPFRALVMLVSLFRSSHRFGQACACVAYQEEGIKISCLGCFGKGFYAPEITPLFSSSSVAHGKKEYGWLPGHGLSTGGSGRLYQLDRPFSQSSRHVRRCLTALYLSWRLSCVRCGRILVFVAQFVQKAPAIFLAVFSIGPVPLRFGGGMLCPCPLKNEVRPGARQTNFSSNQFSEKSRAASGLG